MLNFLKPLTKQFMKKYLLAVLLFFTLLAQNVLAQEAAPIKAKGKYILEPNHSSISWVVSHMGFSNVSGKFTDLKGEIVFDETKPESSSVNVTINTNSISTGLPKFDAHLKSKDFLNVKDFPTAHFVSTKVTPDKNSNITKSARIEGNLTLLGITKPITLNARFNKVAVNPMNQKESVGFSANTVIKRSDFGITYGLPNIPDMIVLTIEVEANR